MLKACVKNEMPFRYVLNAVWFAVAGRSVPQVLEAERIACVFTDAHQDDAEQPFLFVALCLRRSVLTSSWSP